MASDDTDPETAGPEGPEASDQVASAQTDALDAAAGFNAFTQTDFRTAFMTWWIEYSRVLSEQTPSGSLVSAEED